MMLWSAQMLCEICGSMERDAVLTADSRDGAFNLAQDCRACGHRSATHADWESLRPLSIGERPRDAETPGRLTDTEASSS
jgi:hypothetical protein